MNLLALAGDPPEDWADRTVTEGDFRYSCELIELARDEYEFSIGAACFPEVHVHATDAEADLRYLQGEGGSGRALPDHAAVLRQPGLLRLRGARARRSGSTSRSSRASWPITNVSQIKRVTEMCGAKLPAPMLREFELRGDEAGAVADLGVAYATLQCADLLATGRRGSTSTRSTARRRRERSSARCG